MRVQLRRKQKDERGAVAMLVAVMTVVLMVISAFVIDLGMAYVSKRQLQTSSDAAALAAARVYADEPGNCATLAADGALLAEAQAAADDYRERNRPDSNQEEFDVGCNDEGELTVTYVSTGETATGFARLVPGIGDSITTGRLAEATVDVARSGSGMRPMAICSSQLPADWQNAGVVRISFPGPTGWTPPTNCPVPSGPTGNWWTLDCPEDRTGGTSTLAEMILNGCEEPVSIVPNQPAGPVPLTTHLITSCPSAPIHSETCLSGDPGQLDAGQIEDAWRALMDNETKVFLPIFCGSPDCAGSTIFGMGTNAVFPVYKLAGMQVCGFHFNRVPASNQGANPTGDCAGLPINPLTDNTRDNYLLVKFSVVMVSGGTESNDCGLGDSCDTGLRRVHLSK